jgi:hypothetical protein
MAHLIPGESALDEKHRPVRITLCSCRGTNHVRTLADRQRLIARNEIDVMEAALERSG